MNKPISINIRVSKKTLGLIDDAAEIEGKSRSAFLRDCAEKAARKIFRGSRWETPAERGAETKTDAS